MLGLLVLALGRDARGDVGHAHGGAGGVHALAAGAAGAEGVETQVRLLDVQLDVVAHVGHDVHGGEGGVAAAGSIEGRDADQAVDAALALQKTEGVRARDAQGHTLDAGFITGKIVQLLHGEMAPGSPAGVHAQQHLRPVLRFRAARAGVDLQDGVLVVLLTGEQHDQLRLVQQGVQGVLLFRQGFQGLVLVAFHGQFQPFVHVVMAGLEGVEAGDLVLQPAFFAQQGGQGFRIVPGVGAGKFRFDGGKALFAGRDVKDAPKGCRNAGRGAGNGHEDH